MREASFWAVRRLINAAIRGRCTTSTPMPSIPIPDISRPVVDFCFTVIECEVRRGGCDHKTVRTCIDRYGCAPRPELAVHQPEGIQIHSEDLPDLMRTSTRISPSRKFSYTCQPVVLV